MPNLIVEIPKATLSEIRRKTKLIGTKKRLAEKANVHPNTITNLLRSGTADVTTFEKITAALQAA